jgi:hypothetical protein
MGPSAKAILSSGNPEKDRAEQDEFVRLANSKYRIQISSIDPGRAMLVIGAEDWPFPVPIVRTKDKWSFDASVASTEMQARVIGAHELDAIEICYGYADAQRSYASEDRDKDGMLKYASHLTTLPQIPPSFAQAEWTGEVKGRATPYHGYYFRVLYGQGSNAPGGAHSYLLHNKLVGGFGLVAWPAEYGVTGIHTFIMNQQGTVYEKDIPPVPGKPSPVTTFNPDSTWQPVD